MYIILLIITINKYIYILYIHTMYIQKNINVGVRIDHPSLAITLNVFVFQTADAAICSNHTSFAETNAVAFVHFHVQQRSSFSQKYFMKHYCISIVSCPRAVRMQPPRNN